MARVPDPVATSDLTTLHLQREDAAITDHDEVDLGDGLVRMARYTHVVEPDPSVRGLSFDQLEDPNLRILPGAPADRWRDHLRHSGLQQRAEESEVAIVRQPDEHRTIKQRVPMLTARFGK